MDEHIQTIIARVPALRGRDVAIAPLDGGLTNRNYRVDVDGKSYVLRVAGAGTGLLGIDREREVACCNAVAAAGVGPEVIASLPAQQALVTAFLPGKLLATEDTRDGDVLRRLARVVRRYHDFPAPAGLGSFCAFAAIRSNCALAEERGAALPADLPRARELLNAIEGELKTEEPPCLCHNDLLPANFIDAASGMRIIDWEYGGLGDRFFDLGNLAVNFQFDEAQEEALVAAYFGQVEPGPLRRVRLMRLASDMREATWGYLQACISTLHSPGYYLDYGRKHLDRFLAISQSSRTSR